jgi:uncharacterized protein
MARIEKHAPGSFCWAELGTTDPDAAKKFYTELFGWTSVDHLMGEGSYYTIFQLHGDDAAGLYGLNRRQVEAGVAPHWIPHVAVSSADEITARARDLGAHILAGPMDVFEAGRMAVVQDPQGAQLCIWQAKNHIGSRLGDLNNRHCWTELATPDAPAAKDFYTRLFGWTAHVQDWAGEPYTTWMNQGTPVGGMIEMSQARRGVPPHWMVYFSVPSCDERAAWVASVGGSIKVQPADIPNVGRFCVAGDPQGASFSMIQPTFQEAQQARTAQARRAP